MFFLQCVNWVVALQPSRECFCCTNRYKNERNKVGRCSRMGLWGSAPQRVRISRDSALPASSSCGTCRCSADQRCPRPAGPPTNQTGAMMPTWHLLLDLENGKEMKHFLSISFSPPQVVEMQVFMSRFFRTLFGLFFLISYSKLLRSCYLFFLSCFFATPVRENFGV